MIPQPTFRVCAGETVSKLRRRGLVEKADRTKEKDAQPAVPQTTVRGVNKREDLTLYEESMHAYTKALISGEEDDIHFHRQKFLPMFFEGPVVR